MEFRVDPVKMIAALKAVREFVSQDPTRDSIRNVLVEADAKGVSFTSTDGHTLCRVTLSCDVVNYGTVRVSPSALAKLESDARAVKTAKFPIYAVLAKLESDARAVKTAKFPIYAVTLADDKALPEFPNYRLAIPPQVSEGSKAPAVLGFNAVYLARIGHVQKLLKAPYVRVQHGAAATHALRVDIAGALGDAVVVVMPVRI